MSEEQASYEAGDNGAALIAVHIMGWEKIGENFPHYRNNKGAVITTWHPETDEQQAMQIAQRLRELGWMVVLELLPDGGRFWPDTPGCYRCGVGKFTEPVRVYAPIADSLAQAIYQAALQVAKAMKAGQE